MSTIIQVKRGLEEKVRDYKLRPGEPAFTVDTHCLYFGLDDNQGNVKFSFGGDIFVNNIEPVNTNKKIGNKKYQENTIPENIVLESCSTDTKLLRITYTVQGIGSTFTPIVKLGNNTSNNLQVLENNYRTYTGSIDVNLDDLLLVDDNTYLLDILSSTNSRQEVLITYIPFGPSINNIIIGEYPNGQTHLKEDDILYVTVNTDIDSEYVKILPTGLSKTEVILDNYVDNGTYKTFTGNIIVSDITNNASILANAYNLIDTPGSLYTTPEQVIDQVVPEFIDIRIIYPEFQYAFKNNEVGQIINTVTNYDSIEYISDDFDIDLSNTYEHIKVITRKDTARDYNDSEYNFTIRAIKNNNNSIIEYNLIIKIANVAPTYWLENDNDFIFRSGTDTNPEQYIIKINSNQELKSAYIDVDESYGSFLYDNCWANNTKQLYNIFLSKDSNLKGQYSFTRIRLINYANIEVEVIDISQKFNNQGFTSRDYYIAAYPNRIVDLGTYVYDINKLKVFFYSTYSNGIYSSGISNGIDNTYDICIKVSSSTLVSSTTGNILYWKDLLAASSNTTGTAKVRIEETI